MTDQPEALRVATKLDEDFSLDHVTTTVPYAARLLREQHDEIERLRAERNTAQANLASMQIGWENWRVTHSTAFKDTEIERLREQLRLANIDALNETAENEALRRDAERYRWLRTNCYSDKYPYSEFDSAMQLSFTVSGIWANNRDPAVLDGCLDTAMGGET